jgi:hypothetical protein
MAELRDKAVTAIEEAASAAADRGQVLPRIGLLRFALAFLANFTDDDDRHIFDDLWRALTAPPPDGTLASRFGRNQTINACMNGLYRAAGVKRRWEDRQKG